MLDNPPAPGGAGESIAQPSPADLSQPAASSLPAPSRAGDSNVQPVHPALNMSLGQLHPPAPGWVGDCRASPAARPLLNPASSHLPVPSWAGAGQFITCHSPFAAEYCLPASPCVRLGGRFTHAACHHSLATACCSAQSPCARQGGRFPSHAQDIGCACHGSSIRSLQWLSWLHGRCPRPPGLIRVVAGYSHLYLSFRHASPSATIPRRAGRRGPSHGRSCSGNSSWIYCFTLLQLSTYQ